MEIKIIYSDDNVLVVDKPAGIVVFDEVKNDGEPRQTIIKILIEKYPELKSAGTAPRYGIVHRLDKDTSGVILVAKNTESLIFLQKQFINRSVQKKYIALAIGRFKPDKSPMGHFDGPVTISPQASLVGEDSGIIHTLIGRSPADPGKQKAYPLDNPKKGLREAVTEYKVLERFADYTLLEIDMKTGRKHQIRCHLAHIHHPVAGDKMYGFKDSKVPEGLTRQFLHAAYLKAILPNREEKEFSSELPNDLQKILSIIRNTKNDNIN